MSDTKPETWLERTEFQRLAPPRECDACRAKLFPGDWLTRDGCTYCDAGLDLLTPWGQT